MNKNIEQFKAMLGEVDWCNLCMEFNLDYLTYVNRSETFYKYLIV